MLGQNHMLIRAISMGLTKLQNDLMSLDTCANKNKDKNIDRNVNGKVSTSKKA